MSTLERDETIYELIQKEWKLLLTLFVAGILFYIYPICHQAITIDNEGHILTQTFSWYLRSKRWGILLVQKLFFMRTFVPGFWIVVNMALLSLATVITCDLFRFKREWLKYLFGLLIISFPQYTHMMKFALTADAVGVGFILVTLGFWSFMRFNSWKANLSVLLLFIGTFSIYVSLIYIPLTLFLIHSSVLIASGELTMKEWVKKSLRLGIITALAYVLYYYISKAILLYYGISTETPAYFTNMIRWGKEPLLNILHRIPKEVGKHFEGRAYFGEKPFALVWIPFAVSLFFILRQKVSASKKVLATLLLGASMIAPFIQIVLLGAYQPPRAFFAQPFLFAFLWCFAIQLLPRIKPELIITGLAILFVHNGYRVTQAFHYDRICEDSEKNLISRVLSRIETMGLNIQQHRLLIVGPIDPAPVYPRNPYSFSPQPIRRTFTSKGDGWRIPAYLQAHGFTRNVVVLPTKAMIDELTPAIEQMPVWPQTGSVALMNDIIVVKLTKNPNWKKWYPPEQLPKK